MLHHGMLNICHTWQVIKICTQKSCENGKEVEASELNEAKQRVSTESTLFCSDEKGGVDIK